MPPVTGVLETALHVDDLERASHFYESVFGFERMAFDQRFRAFNVAGRQVLLLFKKGGSLQPMPTPGGTIPPHGGDGQLHLAFAIAEADLASWEQWLTDQGIVIESKVAWDRGGRSLYFRDPDQHLLELVTPGCWPNY